MFAAKNPPDESPLRVPGVRAPRLPEFRELEQSQHRPLVPRHLLAHLALEQPLVQVTEQGEEDDPQRELDAPEQVLTELETLEPAQPEDGLARDEPGVQQRHGGQLLVTAQQWLVPA